jgi:hypothetical protein
MASSPTAPNSPVDDAAGGQAFALDVGGDDVTVPIVGSDGQSANAIEGFAASGQPVLVSGELTCDSSQPNCRSDAVRLVAAESTAARPALEVVG